MDEEIIKVIKEITKNDEITLNQNVKDVGFDSITFVKIAVKIEEVYDIEFDDDMLIPDKFSTITSIVEYVVEKI